VAAGSALDGLAVCAAIGAVVDILTPSRNVQVIAYTLSLITQESQHFVRDVNGRLYFYVNGSNRFDAGTLFA
jgi:hypothetical protein